MDFSYNDVIVGVSHSSGAIQFGYVSTVATLYGAQIKACILNKEVRTIPNANVFHIEIELSTHTYYIILLKIKINLQDSARTSQRTRCLIINTSR